MPRISKVRMKCIKAGSVSATTQWYRKNKADINSEALEITFHNKNAVLTEEYMQLDEDNEGSPWKSSTVGDMELYEDWIESADNEEFYFDMDDDLVDNISGESNNQVQSNLSTLLEKERWFRDHLCQ